MSIIFILILIVLAIVYALHRKFRRIDAEVKELDASVADLYKRVSASEAKVIEIIPPMEIGKATRRKRR